MNAEVMKHNEKIKQIAQTTARSEREKLLGVLNEGLRAIRE